MNLTLKPPEQTFEFGALYVVSTPIGNLADITLRALSVLEQADVICAEDTRVTQQLLNAYGINAKQLVSLREQNEARMAEKVCEWLQKDLMVAQVSDAGTPAICDPGSRLVKIVRRAGFQVYSVPGACALVSALSLTGIQADCFSFIGFLPTKKQEKAIVLDRLASINEPVVCYETPHRILSTLEDIASKMLNRNIFLIRELTKRFETVLTGTALQIKNQLIADPYQQKGEMVIVFDLFESDVSESIPTNIKVLAEGLLDFVPIKKITTLLSSVADFNKKELYAYLLSRKNLDKDL